MPKTASPAQRAKWAEQRSAKVDALTASLAAKVESFRSSEDWTAYLDVQARFHSYSARNALLILIQRPDATRVAGFRKWQEFGRQVRAGERGISILAPVIVKRENKKTGLEEKALVNFTVTTVFDISQTDGEPLPEHPSKLLVDGADVPTALYDALAAQVAEAGFTLERDDCSAAGSSANGYTDHAAKVVRVRDDLSQTAATKTLAHELAHVLLHPDNAEYQITRRRCEVEAESVAYVVLAAHDVASDDYSLGYVAGWSEGEPKLVQETATRVAATAKKILEKIG